MSNSPSPSKNLLSPFKAVLLIVAASFLAYSIYWLINGLIWGYTVTQMLLHTNQISILTSMGTAELTALFIQEYSSVANSFIILLSGFLAFQATTLFIKKGAGYLRKLRGALVLTAVFSLLLVPASVHHLVGVALGWTMVDIYVGLSYLLQALLIVPSLLVLSQKMRNPQNPAAIQKWAAIAASSFVFALYFKYLFLWVDTLVPLGPKQASVAASVGAANSVLTLLIAGAVMAAGCYLVNQKKSYGKGLVAAGVTVVGVFFAIYSLVSLSVPIYASFWYLTDFWMLSLLILGIVALAYKTTPS